MSNSDCHGAAPACLFEDDSSVGRCVECLLNDDCVEYHECVDETCVPLGVNAGFIGGSCESDSECLYLDGTCLPDSGGFPNGHCSSPCDLYCPDRDGAVITFCVSGDNLGLSTDGGWSDGGWCVMQCPELGCRDGYHCEAVSRHNEPETVKQVCIPD